MNHDRTNYLSACIINLRIMNLAGGFRMDVLLFCFISTYNSIYLFIYLFIYSFIFL